MFIYLFIKVKNKKKKESAVQNICEKKLFNYKRFFYYLKKEELFAVKSFLFKGINYRNKKLLVLISR